MSKVHSPKGLRISDEVHKALRIKSAETGESMGDIAERALRRELGIMTTVVCEMSEQELQDRVIGQVWDPVTLLGLDWIDRYPVVDSDDVIVDVVVASDGHPEGLEWEEQNECYRLSE